MHLLMTPDAVHSQSSPRKGAVGARNRNSSSARPMMAVAKAALSEIENGQKGPERVTFTEDFLVEHSLVSSPCTKSNIEQPVAGQLFGFFS